MYVSIHSLLSLADSFFLFQSCLMIEQRKHEYFFVCFCCCWNVAYLMGWLHGGRNNNNKKLTSNNNNHNANGVKLYAMLSVTHKKTNKQTKYVCVLCLLKSQWWVIFNCFSILQVYKVFCRVVCLFVVFCLFNFGIAYLKKMLRIAVSEQTTSGIWRIGAIVLIPFPVKCWDFVTGQPGNGLSELTRH